MISTTWGMEQLPYEVLLQRIKDGGFDGVEMGVPAESAPREKLRGLLRDLGLVLIAQQWTAGSTAAEHAESFAEQYMRSILLEPVLVNSHTGKDFYTLEENLHVFRRAKELEREHGVPVAHETHRGRATFSAISTRSLLEAMPDLRLTADFSHWCCVHESWLENQPEALERAIRRSTHIHARVGHPEGPQVTDPRAPEWKEAVETHLGWWQRIAARRREEGAELLTVCPEFGPPGYMMTQPYTRQPVVELWDVNMYMKQLVQERLHV